MVLLFQPLPRGAVGRAAAFSSNHHTVILPSSSQQRQQQHPSSEESSASLRPPLMAAFVNTRRISGSAKAPQQATRVSMMHPLFGVGGSVGGGVIGSSSGRRTTRIVAALSDETTSEEEKVDNGVNKHGEEAEAAAAAAAAAQRLRQDAARIRLEATKMDWELTVSKLETLQDKIDRLKKKKKDDPEKVSAETVQNVEEQLQIIRDKILDNDNDNMATTRRNMKTKVSDDTAAGTKMASSSSTIMTEDRRRRSSVAAAKEEITTTEVEDEDEEQAHQKQQQQQQEEKIVVVSSSANGSTTLSTSSRSSSSDEVQQQLRQDPHPPRPSTTTSDGAPSASSSAAAAEEEENPTTTTTTTTAVLERPKAGIDDIDDDDEVSLSGFDRADLELYLPVATEIERRLTNMTREEKLEAFRSAPELQEHFRKKLTELIIAPIQDVAKLETLRKEYLQSNSFREKDHLKRQMDRLEEKLERDDRYAYSDDIYNADLTPPLTEERKLAQLRALQELPDVLQTLYKRRYQLPSDEDNLELAILLDHYEIQLQLLDQVQNIGPLDESQKQQVVQAVTSLPMPVREHVASNVLGLERNETAVELLVEKYCEPADEDEDDDEMEEGGLWSLLQSAAQGGTSTTVESNDIEFLDRSRYLNEFFPSVARLEGQQPDPEQVAEQWNLMNKQYFMVTCKPERVVGGYYIRGRNLVRDDDSGTELMEKLAALQQPEDWDYYYIPDPSPISDEEVELEYRNEPVFLVTAKNATALYNPSKPLTKAAVSLLGIVSMFGFALATVAMDPSLQERLDVASEVVAAGGIVEDMSWLREIVWETFFSLVAIQFFHDLGHRFVGWRDKFEVGVTTTTPSIQLGCMGTITPFRSPPPNLKSMFDFGVAGPLAGMIASLAFLVQGLAMTAGDWNSLTVLPVLPTNLLRCSALGGGLIEFFLGKGALVQGMAGPSDVLPLHPLAISGFVGLLINSLALLPLGNTDGGRISIAMFGRRGSFIVKTFTTFLLCGAGIFGLDNSGILLSYVLYTVLFQRELETPARNEVEELDFPRGAFAIALALWVALVLLPMQ